MLKEHNIAEVSVGMYVVEITAPKDKFRLRSQGWLESERVIEALRRKGVERLLIDGSKTRDAEPLVAQASTETQAAPLKKTVAPREVKTPKPATASAAVPGAGKSGSRGLAKEEIIKAKQVFDESKAIQKGLFHNAQHGLPLDMPSVNKITSESTEVIFNNPDALACVINIRKKDEYLLEHSVAVSVLMTMFAVYLKLDKDIIQQLAIGAYLHDVGKIMVPDAILNKPGKLSDAEFELMKSHASHSIAIMRKTPGLSPLSLEVAALHHEKLNGKGYPMGVSSEQISRYGRMISICDIFDALTANRCYKDGYSQVKAFNILRALAANNELDAELVDQFIRCMGVYPVGSVVQLESNRLAIVESRNAHDPIRPRVRPFYHISPKRFEVGEDIDLATVTDDLIVKCVRADDFNLDMQEILDLLAHEG
ncbi:HD-GYP domain-containing protein [Shewanella cyperi]|uniref:HD-GYP domain-containing protein n=1 Tax=Shewanella cyperi TaxID=2814292 RepID=UPI001A93B8F8|nr:HD-GYP domain-containing protein [Shewanella cyperi]QSX41712.1 HD-GYP domain-containing protein [Shewanella cyperi]